jgi:hypothetical protein
MAAPAEYSAPPARISQKSRGLAFWKNNGMKMIRVQPITRYIVSENLGIEFFEMDLYSMPNKTIAHCMESITMDCHPPITEIAIGVYVPAIAT